MILSLPNKLTETQEQSPSRRLSALRSFGQASGPGAGLASPANHWAYGPSLSTSIFGGPRGRMLAIPVCLRSLDMSANAKQEGTP